MEPPLHRGLTGRARDTEKVNSYQSFRQPFVEQRHDRAAEADHIAIAHDAEGHPMSARHFVRRHEQFVGGALSGAVQVDGLCGLIG